MKLHHFRDVIAIAEAGSIRAAARRLQLAQPALTRSLSELERELGAPLFERQSRGMVLTPNGHAFTKRATLILSEVRRAREDIQQLESGGGDIVVALSIAAHIALLPKAFGPFRSRYPNVKLHLIEGLYPTLEGQIRTGKIDFFVGPRPDLLPPSELLVEDLFENTRVILCRKGHAMSAAKSLSELSSAEWCTTSITQRAEEELESLFEQHGLLPPRRILQTQSALTLLIVLAYSDILAMGPVQWSSFAPTSTMLDIICVREALPAPTIVLIRRADAPLTPAAMYLADLMRRGVPR